MAAVARGMGVAAPRAPAAASYLCLWGAGAQLPMSRFPLPMAGRHAFRTLCRQTTASSTLSHVPRRLASSNTAKPTARPPPKPAPQPPKTATAAKTAGISTPETLDITTRDVARTSPVCIHDVSPTEYAAALATRPQPTLIYEAPSHALMFAAYWTGAAMMVATMAVPALMVLSTPTEGLASWVLPAYNIILVSSGCIGAGIVYAGVGTVNKITALSSNRSRLRQVHVDKMLWLEIEVKRVLPFLKPYRIKAPMQRVRLEPGSLAAMLAIPRSDWEILRTETERLMAAEAKYDEEHTFTLPLRRVWRGITGFFRNLVYAISRREFSKLKVLDKQLQIHVTGGWALEDGLALDKLLGEGKFEGKP